MKLDEYEQDILDSFKKGEWKSVPNFEERKKELETAAKTYLKSKTKSKVK